MAKTEEQKNYGINTIKYTKLKYMNEKQGKWQG